MTSFIWTIYFFFCLWEGDWWLFSKHPPKDYIFFMFYFLCFYICLQVSPFYGFLFILMNVYIFYMFLRKKKTEWYFLVLIKAQKVKVGYTVQWKGNLQTFSVKARAFVKLYLNLEVFIFYLSMALSAVTAVAKESLKSETQEARHEQKATLLHPSPN